MRLKSIIFHDEGGNETKYEVIAYSKDQEERIVYILAQEDKKQIHLVTMTEKVYTLEEEQQPQ